MKIISIDLSVNPVTGVVRITWILTSGQTSVGFADSWELLIKYNETVFNARHITIHVG